MNWELSSNRKENYRTFSYYFLLDDQETICEEIFEAV